jgi:hypothetical protein
VNPAGAVEPLLEVAPVVRLPLMYCWALMVPVKIKRRKQKAEVRK